MTYDRDKAQLDVVGGEIAGWHCSRSRERYERESAAGTWKPRGMTSYNGQLLHEASSAVTRTRETT